MNQNTPARQQVAFPDVAIIHKGTPKQIVKKEGKQPMEIQGKDLNQKFRIHFLPGTEKVRADFHKLHEKELKHYGENFTIPDGYEVTSFRAVVPAPSVWDAWDYGNEVYNSGRRIAFADDDHYITLRDPLTGEYIIRDGLPFKPFTVGDTIDYERDGRKFSLKMKTHGRLRLCLEDALLQGHLVQFILKTTSYYDCQNIKKQLAGIQAIADMVNGGNAGGIPFEVYRAESDVVWNKPDGSAARVKKWFIQIKADPEWVKSAFSKLGRNALTVANSLMLPAPLTGPVNPANETFEDSEGDPSYEPPFSNAAEEQSERQSPEVSPAGPPTDPQADPSGGVEAFNYLSEKIVKTVAEIAKTSTKDAAHWLGEAHKEGRIGKEMTLDQARDFASHLNV